MGTPDYHKGIGPSFYVVCAGLFHAFSSSSFKYLYDAAICDQNRIAFTAYKKCEVLIVNELMEALPKIRGNGTFTYPPELIGQIEKMTLEDNPVLVLYTLK